MNTPFIVGISGASGSGKTTFIRQLLRYFSPGEVCLISMDNYYKPRQEQPIDENGFENYDTLHSLSVSELLHDIQLLASGNAVERLEYDFNNPEFISKKLVLTPAKVIVLEGLFIFSYSEIFSLLDFKIFLEAEDHLRITRRLRRDLTERGYTVEQTLYWMENHVEPAYKNLVLPFKNMADIIVPNNHNFDKALETVAIYIQSKLQRSPGS